MMNEQEMQPAAPERRSPVVRVIKRVIIGAVVLYGILVIVRTGQLVRADEVAKKVAEIHSIRLTLADVDGSKLPPAPDQVQNDATVAGIDANKNYVRDDIERWIFDHYADPRERAVWMQWARSEEFVMTRAVDKETLVAVMEEGDRANQCGGYLYTSNKYWIEEEEFSKRAREIDNLVWNTDIRKLAKTKGYSYMTGSGPMEGQQCDVFPETK